MEGMFPYQCTYCLCCLTNVRIKCAVCKNFQLCLQCFSYGAEIGDHLNKHSYKLLGDHSLYKCFGTKWKARDELALLCAVEKHGYGNWRTIARSMRKEFSAYDVRKHYQSVYIYGNIGRATLGIHELPTIIDFTSAENNVPSPELNPNESCNVPVEYQQQLVYLPYRDDYEIEYDNEAESLVCDLVFYPDDDEVEQGLKLAQICMYNEKLNRRFNVKKMVREHNIINSFFNSESQTKPLLVKNKFPSDCEMYEEFLETMQIFTRFYSRYELLHFYESLKKEKEMKQKILHLTKLRMWGCKKFEDAKRLDCMVPVINEKIRKVPYIFLIDGKYMMNNNIVSVKKRRKKRKLKFTRRKGSSK